MTSVPATVYVSLAAGSGSVVSGVSGGAGGSDIVC